MLIIPNVRESDNGEYCCIASNGIGEPAKSCGALQLKMSMSGFLPGHIECRPDFSGVHILKHVGDGTSPSSTNKYPVA